MTFNLILFIVILLIYFVTHIGKRKKENNDKLFLIIVFSMFFILVGYREMTRGNDTISYLRLFEQCATNKWNVSIFNNYYEFGYLIFNILVSYISNNSRFFLIVLSFLFNYSIYSFIKKNSNNYLVSVLMYVGLMYFYSSMNIIRQFLAIIIILYSFNFVKEKKLFPFLFFVLLATTIHSSAIISLLIYPIYHCKYNKKRVFIVIIISIFLLLSLDIVYPFVVNILNRDTYYLNRIGVTKIFNVISFLLFLGMFIFSTCITRNKNYGNNNFYLFVLLFTSCVSMISINMAVLERVCIYYSMFSIVALPNLIHNSKIKDKFIINALVVLVLFIYSSTTMIYRPNWNTAFDYKTCIFPKSDYVCY